MSSKTSNDNNALHEVRKAMGLTQREIALKVGISRSLWSALENRQRPLTVALLNRMQDKLGLTDEQVEKIRLWWGESHLVLGSASTNKQTSAA